MELEARSGASGLTLPSTAAASSVRDAEMVGVRSLTWIAAVAFLLRWALFAAVAARTGATLLDYAESADGAQYLFAAKSWLVGPGLLAGAPGVRRFFPGVPMLIAALWRCGVPPAWAALMPSWLAAAGAAALAAWWARDLRVGWAMAAVPPIYLYASSLISTETLAVALSLAGVVLCRRRRPLLGGLALGLAVFCRPFALFAVIAAIAGELVARRRRAAAWLVGGVAVVGVAGLAVLQAHSGDALQSARTYRALHGGIVAWPFESLLLTPWRTAVPLWKVPYVWAHAAVALLACVVAVAKVRRAKPGEERAEAVTVAIWLVGLVGFTLCLASAWAFHDFPRFLVPALPPLYVALRDYLPRSRWVWTAVAAASFALALQPAARNVRTELGPGSSVEALWGTPAAPAAALPRR